MGISTIGCLVLIIVSVYQNKKSGKPWLKTRTAQFATTFWQSVLGVPILVVVCCKIAAHVSSPLIAPVLPLIIVLVFTVIAIRRSATVQNSLDWKILLLTAISWIPVTVYVYFFWEIFRTTGGYIPIPEMVMLVYSPVCILMTLWASNLFVPRPET